MRLVGTLATVLILAGCVPAGADRSFSGATSARRCFSPTETRLIKFQPGEGAYVRARTGEALLLTGPAACLDVTEEASIGLRARGLEGSDVCIGDRAHLDIRSHAAIFRTCDVRVSRVAPQSEIAQLADRQSP
jgi:hypothetical protein